ncbi:MAG: hypothetical protein LM550_16415 [Candidatus Contendobacter sp.]|nr:hypothetical protein [Gammaproteobacteria bacterium]MCC8995231.1 hypothetical protein [Candidatus Contendobacter sp.]
MQNIEFGIISVYREHPQMVDYTAMRALEALIDHYVAQKIGRALQAVCFRCSGNRNLRADEGKVRLAARHRARPKQCDQSEPAHNRRNPPVPEADFEIHSSLEQGERPARLSGFCGEVHSLAVRLYQTPPQNNH